MCFDANSPSGRSRNALLPAGRPVRVDSRNRSNQAASSKPNSRHCRQELAIEAATPRSQIENVGFASPRVGLALDQCHSCADAAKPARRGFCSTYTIAFDKCSSSRTPVAEFGEEGEVELAVFLAEKDLLAIVPPLGHVVGEARGNDSRRSWHIRECVEDRILSRDWNHGLWHRSRTQVSKRDVPPFPGLLRSRSLIAPN